jgi:hypothetical protein
MERRMDLKKLVIVCKICKTELERHPLKYQETHPTNYCPNCDRTLDWDEAEVSNITDLQETLLDFFITFRSWEDLPKYEHEEFRYYVLTETIRNRLKTIKIIEKDD